MSSKEPESGFQDMVLGGQRDMFSIACDSAAPPDARLSRLLDKTPDIYCCYDSNLRIRWINAAAKALFSARSKPFTGSRCYEIWHGRNIPCENCPVVQARDSGLPAHAEVTSNDGRIWLVHAYPAGDTEGRVNEVLEHAVGITERKNAENAQHLNEEQNRRFVEASPNIVYTFSSKRGAVFWSKRVASLLGFDIGRLKDDPWLWTNSIHPEDLPAVQRVIEDSFTGKSFEIEYRIRDIHGEWHWLLDKSIGITRLEDEVLIEGIAEDITERRLAENALRAKTEELDQHFNTAMDLFCVASTDGVFLKVNRQWESLLGYSRSELEGRHFIEFVPPDDKEATLLATARLKNHEQVVDFVNRFQCRNGEYRWMEWRSVPAGELVYAVARDITARVRLEQDYRALFDNMLAGVAFCELLCDPEGKPTDCRFQSINPAFESITGLRVSEVVERSLLEIMPNIEPLWLENYGHAVATGQPAHFEGYVKDLDKHFEVTAYALPERRFASVFLDMTDRKRTEAALQHQVLALTRPLDEPETIQFSDLFNIADIQRIQDEFSDATGVASIITHPDGTPITRPSNFCRLCIEIIRNTEKGRENCFRSDAALGRHHPSGPILQPCLSGGLWDAGASITVGGRHIANWLIGQVRNEEQNEEHMLQYADKIGADRDTFRKALAEVPIMPKEQFSRVATALFTFANELSLRAYQNLQQARFIAERKQAEEERLEMERHLLHAQKLESLGVLAGGIAHDFNNLLMAILGNLDLALEDIGPFSSIRERIEQAVLAARRAADLTRQMLAYSGKGAFVVHRINLSELVAENASMLRATIPKNVEFLMALDQNLPPIRADAGQIQQIIMNLITNAAEAIGDQPGTLRLSTGTEVYEAATLATSRIDEKPGPGRFVWVEVADTGCGMSEEARQRLFDPFFTTKFTGRGLGMSAVHGIVKGHHGAVLLSSAPGAGTTIRVLIPACEPMAAPAVSDKLQKPQKATAAVPQRSGTILVVDDEDIVRNLCAKLVQRLGFNVVQAADGEEALTRFQQRQEEIVCVLLDLTMPRMDGVATFHALRRIDPNVKVLLCSGYSEQDATERFSGHGLNGFLQKPYRLNMLQDELNRIAVGPDTNRT